MFKTKLLKKLIIFLKPSPPGGYNDIEADSENIKKLALFSLDSITQQTMSKRSLGLIRVVSAKSQV